MKNFCLMIFTVFAAVLLVVSGEVLYGQSPSGGAAPFALERCELVPLPDNQVSFQIDGAEKTRWHFGAEYPRPFFYPFNGPSGVSLTRMGHPGAQNHDHHRSVWLAHYSVNGRDFWSDGTETQVRQRMWRGYRDGDDTANMATLLGWYDSHGKQLMEQEMVASLIPLAGGEHALEVQITMRPPGDTESVELGKTNFGLLAVRVAKTLSVHFGGGTLTSSEGQQGEADIFGNPARWIDYSGPVAVGRGADRHAVVEGITYFDHPDNPRYPTHWHVREDGWMGASFCMHDSFTVTRDRPLTLRYLLVAHAGKYDHRQAESLHKTFSQRGEFKVTLANRPHLEFDVEREKESSNETSRNTTPLTVEERTP